MHMLHRVRQVAEEHEALTVVSEVGRQVEMLLALADVSGMLPRDRQLLEREAEAAVDGD